jgi:hypothetical protein
MPPGEVTMSGLHGANRLRPIRFWNVSSSASRRPSKSTETGAISRRRADPALG